MRMTEGQEEKKIFTLRCVLLCLLASGARAYETRVLAHGDDSDVFVNLTAPYLQFLGDVFNYLAGANSNVSEKCNLETKQLLDLSRAGDSNALKILDSSGKPSSGVLEGGVFFIGFYSECVKTVVKPKDIHGKYCLINFNFSSTEHQDILPQASWLVLTQSQKPPTVGVCIPSSCSENDLSYAAVASLHQETEKIKSEVSVCHTNLPSFAKDGGAVAALCFLLIFVLIALIATIFDFIIEKKVVITGNDAAKTVSTEMLCETRQEKSQKMNTLKMCLLAFSFKTNAEKIFAVEKSTGGNIGCLHGLRFLSMVLIIFGHSFSFATEVLFFRNPGAAVQAPKDFVSQILANGTLAVDTFYFISGLLVAFVTLKVMQKANGKLPLLQFYFHRYFRLTPLYMVVILICALLLRYMGSGPNWLFSIQMYDSWCRKNFWTNALYLQNFINTEHMCLSHTWYLATDMQFYIVTPLILIPLHKNIKFGAIAMGVFMVATIVTTAVITAINHYPAIPYINNILPLDLINEYYKNVYIKPYCRMGPYIVGIAVGYYLLHKKELILRKRTVAALWLTSAILALLVIYLMWPANQGHLPTDAEAASYSALARSVWAVTIGWLTIACFYGYGGFINSMLSWSPLVPFSRLTYCAYLIHPVIMHAYYGSTETTVDFSISFMLYLFMGNICLTYVLSLILSMLFESPFVALEKAILLKKEK